MRISDWSSDVCSSDLRDLRQLSSLTLAMAESIANTVGPLLVAEQRALARRWRIWAGISPDNTAALLNHSVDAVVTTTDALDGLEGLESHAILTEPFVLVFPAGSTGPRAPERESVVYGKRVPVRGDLGGS